MLLQFLILTFGLTFLWGGAELLVRNASALGQRVGISPTVIGLTVVSIGTSLPEFVVSLTAALKNTMGISIGNIIGSNIANIGLILGLSAILTTLKVKRRWVFKEVPAMITFTIFFTLFAYTGFQIGRLEGVVLIIFLLAFLYYLLGSSSQEMLESKEFSKSAVEGENDSASQIFLMLFLSATGIVFLVGGSYATVSAGEKIAQALGVSDTVIALTLIAVGTSLPELATSVVGIFRHETDIVVGNIIGSNIFNLLFIGGTVSIIRPIPIERELFFVEFPTLLLLSILVWPFMRIKWNIHRVEGIILLIIYIVFVGLTFSK